MNVNELVNMAPFKERLSECFTWISYHFKSNVDSYSNDLHGNLYLLAIENIWRIARSTTTKKFVLLKLLWDETDTKIYVNEKFFYKLNEHFEEQIYFTEMKQCNYANEITVIWNICCRITTVQILLEFYF